MCENRYQQLFEKLEEAFTAAVVLRDSEGTVQDWRYLEVNPAVKKLFGLCPSGLIGRLASEIFPELDKWWLNAVRQVMETGQSVHFEHYAKAPDSWYELTVFPFGSEQFAILYYDITEKKRRELNANFLNCITGELAGLFVAEEMMETVGELTAEYLRVSGCFFGETGGPVLTTWRGWGQKNVPDVSHAFNTCCDEPFVNACQAGQSLVVRDTQRDDRMDAATFSRFNIGALFFLPFLRHHRWNAAAFVTSPGPRDWRNDEITLLQEICNKVFLRIEAVRAEESLRESEQKFRTLFETMDKGVGFLEVIYNEQGKAVDWMYLSVNNAFCRQLGFNPIDQRASQTGLPVEASWLHLFGQVIERRESGRRQVRVDAIGRWYSIYASPVGESGDVLAVIFDDITERRMAEMAVDRILGRDQIATIGYRIREGERALRTEMDRLSILVEQMHTKVLTRI